MINKDDFKAMRKELLENDNKRELVIRGARDILKDSKRAIYALHRNDSKNASSLLKKAEKGIKNLKKLGKNNYNLKSVGHFNAALQEYVEAATYFGYVKKGKIPSSKELGIDPENYLLGICDLTGELGRRTVNTAIAKKYDEVVKIRNVVEQIYGEFLNFDLRNSELRKKSDSIKWNLNKIEGIVYDLHTKGLIK